MLNQELIIKRLALVKHLYKIALEQSRQSETTAVFSILSFHDSVEMFLKLLAEHKNIGSKNFSFIDYWVNIPSLTLKESMSSFNIRRVNIKHKGILPSKADIEISRVNVGDFFEQNTITQFGIRFNDISLLSLIQYESVRAFLEDSQKYLNENNVEACIENVTIAFDELLDVYENSKDYYESPFFFGRDMTFNRSFAMGMHEDRDMAKFIDDVSDSIQYMQKAIKIISFGIDYKKYVKFSMLTPLVTKTMGRRRILEVMDNKKWTKENCQYCIDFVLDCSLKLQEFDFDIGELIDITIPDIFIDNASE